MKLTIKTDLVGNRYEFYHYASPDFLGFINTNFNQFQLEKMLELKNLDESTILERLKAGIPHEYLITYP